MQRKGSSPTPNDNEVSIHLVFRRKDRTTSEQTPKEKLGTKRGPATRGTIKKSINRVLEESCQNTLKRRRLTRAMVVDEEAPLSQFVVLDTETPPYAVEESPEIEKESRRSDKARAKRKQLALSEEPSVEPGGVDILLDSLSLGRILGVPSEGELTVKDKQASKDFQKLIEKLEANLKSDRLFKKQLKPEYQLLFEIVTKSP
ncbi:hypothetical protein HAX54_036964 [Datura stramonium]|uniref:Uncharacterized protein n=1 Tax=Datura stramonium TaxID=4076 RepID=A0ABS8SGT3_DATST|nr:hypothetical protein [Datura stramonium]